MTLPGHGRYPYRAIEGRPAPDWPGGHRLAVYIALNIEVFAFAEGLGAEVRAHAAPAGDDLVEHEQDAVLVADAAQPVQVAPGRRQAGGGRQT